MQRTAKSSTPKTTPTKTAPIDKGKFFKDHRNESNPPTDLEHLAHWRNRITAWFDYIEKRLRTLEAEGMDWRQREAEKDNMLHSRHLTMLYRPSVHEYRAMLRIGIREPLAMQELQGFLRFADAAFDRLDDGPEARDHMASALWGLRDAVDATVKGIEDGTRSGTERADVKTAGEEPLSDEARAVAAYVDDPNQSMTALGRKLGLSRQRLYEMPRLRAAREAHEHSERLSRWNAKPGGEKDAETGRMQAWTRDDNEVSET